MGGFRWDGAHGICDLSKSARAMCSASKGRSDGICITPGNISPIKASTWSAEQGTRSNSPKELWFSLQAQRLRCAISLLLGGKGNSACVTPFFYLFLPRPLRRRWASALAATARTLRETRELRRSRLAILATRRLVVLPRLIGHTFFLVDRRLNDRAISASCLAVGMDPSPVQPYPRRE